MLELGGHRKLFGADKFLHRVPSGSIYGRLAAVGDQLFACDDGKTSDASDDGRPGVPAPVLSGAFLLQLHDQVSDQEAVERILFDLRWKVALHLPLDYACFDCAQLGLYRRGLREGGQARRAFERFMSIARAAGFLLDRQALLGERIWPKHVGAAQDTSTLLRRSIRRLLRDLDYARMARRKLLGQVQRLIDTYLEGDREVAIDWADARDCSARLQVLVEDAERTLDLAAERADDLEVWATGWLLGKLVGSEMVRGAQASGSPHRVWQPGRLPAPQRRGAAAFW